MRPTAENCVEIRVRGRWVKVPALDVNGKKLIATGKRLRTAMVRSEEMMENELENPELYIKKLKDDGNRALRADIFTFTQKLPATLPKYHYPMEWESIAAVHLVTFKEWWESLPQETRKNVRRSQKRGVVVRIKEFDDDLIQGIREVNDNSPLRQGMRNAYYGKSSEETKKLYGEFLGRCDFICAYFGEELIGFLHLVYRGEIASILNLTTKPSHFDKRPANVLVAKAAEVCEARGIPYLTYGLYNYGNKRDSSLREFKIRNGFREIRVPRFFVPLTRWGRLCMKAKLHRGLIGILPHSLITIGARARSLWYILGRS
jgi:Acetyltransferase (GNAT) domain